MVWGQVSQRSVHVREDTSVVRPECETLKRLVGTVPASSPSAKIKSERKKVKLIVTHRQDKHTPGRESGL